MSGGICREEMGRYSGIVEGTRNSLLGPLLSPRQADGRLPLQVWMFGTLDETLRWASHLLASF